jgi:hypothetical protein
MLGLYITIGVIVVLAVVFLVSMLFHRSNKERKHMPNVPSGLDVSNGYTFATRLKDKDNYF